MSDNSTNISQTKSVHTGHVRAILGIPLPDTIPELKRTLRATEKAYTPIMRERVAAQAALQQKRLQYLHPKDPQYTDMDRRIQLEANTSEAQAEVEELAGLEKALEQRIEIILVLLR